LVTLRERFVNGAYQQSDARSLIKRKLVEWRFGKLLTQVLHALSRRDAQMFHQPPIAAAPTLSASSDDPPIADAHAILKLARHLASHGAQGGPLLLKDRNVALVCDDEDTSSNAFCHAARQLGARVSRIKPSLDEHTDPREIQHTARLLGRLYAALEWPRLPTKLQELLRREAGIPVYDGISLREHPVSHWSVQLDVDAPLEDKRRLVIQAILLRDLG
jgi:ornithine carbamoyltransferase